MSQGLFISPFSTSCGGEERKEGDERGRERREGGEREREERGRGEGEEGQSRK